MRRTRGLSLRLIVAIGTLATLQLAVFVTLLVTLHGLRDAGRKANAAVHAGFAADDARLALARWQVATGADARKVRIVDTRLRVLAARSRVTRQQQRDLAVEHAQLAWAAGFTGVLATILCAVGFLAYVRRAILTPLRSVSEAARSLAGGDLRARVLDHGGGGEVAALARTFDQMAASLEDSRSALERQNAELASQSVELGDAVRAAREAEHVKEDFFALVSHELRTPLTAILGYVELVLAEDGLDPEHERHLAVVERNAQRLLRLVGDLLFGAQVERGSLALEPGRVDLPQLVRDAVALARPRAAEARIELVEVVAPLPPSLGDGDRLAQVLDNLLSNALKFTPPGGFVEVRLAARDGAAELTVADTGVGILGDELPHLFDRFYRATNAIAGAVPGLGLGLMISRAIVEGHGGTIAVVSDVESGTTFTVSLPLRDAEHRRPPPSAAAEPYRAGGR